MKCIAIIFVLLLPAPAVADALDSDCTRAALTVVGSKRLTLLTTVDRPTIVDENHKVTIELSTADAAVILKSRRLEEPGTATATAEIERRIQAGVEKGSSLSSSALRPDLDSTPREALRAGVIVSHEVRLLLLRSLLQGLARASVSGREITSAHAEYYEARDEIGKVNGVRVVANGEKLFDYCATDPSK